MQDTKSSGSAKEAPAKTAAKPVPRSQGAKTAVQDKEAALKAVVPEPKKGDYFKFGSYYQENSSEKTPIEWLVLKKSGSKVLLISRYGLDCKQYHHERVDMTWENCDLRKWLNGGFIKNAFTAEEQKKIAVTKLVNDNNAKHGTFGGNSTEDRVFCLSLAEAESLFKGNAARKCVPTPYAVGKKVFKSKMSFINGMACCIWWLRSPGRFQDRAARVHAGGGLAPHGLDVNFGTYAVRPVLWVNL